MGNHRESKITLRQATLEAKPASEVTAEEIVALRRKLRMSQALLQPPAQSDKLAGIAAWSPLCAKS
ncbi:hypothetical protein [Pseudomonas indica]|uniref:hypothetical protein n=1 Tax=Pseudomonas indica TaxID=137658 RepID=UPI000BABCEAA|nr:hypothetical protein [Pseudomonas indica]MBU3057822.1 hypothetical protein [Pseudomonas indica]PAU53567.1 hypothetical protein BZL42_22545 [Pseudomonas indica]